MAARIRVWESQALDTQLTFHSHDQKAMTGIHCTPKHLKRDFTFVHRISSAHDPLAISIYCYGNVVIAVVLIRRTPVQFRYCMLQILYAQNKAQQLK